MRHLAALLVAATTAMAGQGPSSGSTVLFDGATLIAGDGGAPIDRAAFVVEGTRITQVGRSGAVRAPAGAARVDLAGTVVMPAIVDAHTHPPAERGALVEYLKRKASHGSSVAMSLGLDPGDTAF